MAQDNPDGYRKTLEKYSLSPKALQWNSWESQARRIREIIKDINFEDKSVLDVGCGFADLIPFIASKVQTFSYTGVDIVPEFIEFTKAKYPEYQFVTLDYFSHPLPEKFDIVITSGTLNNNSENALQERKLNIRTLFDQAKEAMAFNMAGNHPQPENLPEKRVFYADSLEILEFCFSLTSKVIFRHNYHDKDFTVVLFKQ